MRSRTISASSSGAVWSGEVSGRRDSPARRRHRHRSGVGRRRTSAARCRSGGTPATVIWSRIGVSRISNQRSFTLSTLTFGECQGSPANDLSAMCPGSTAVGRLLTCRRPARRCQRLPRCRAAKTRLQEVESRLEPIPFDSAAVCSYGLIVAAMVGEGRKPRSRFADLVIAATAHAHRLDLCSRNADDLAGLEELVRVIAI